MDPNYSDPEDEATAMAAAMGFSSFGASKPPAKKRKFNAATDAFVEGQVLEKIDKGGKKGQGSGGNNTKLGKQRVFGQSAVPKAETRKQNDDEIDLEDEGDETLQNIGIRNARLAEDNQEEGPQYLDTSLPPPAEAEADDRGGEDGPAYIDTSTEAPIIADSISSAEKAEVQARIDALLASIGSGPPPPSNDLDTAPEYQAASASAPLSPSRNLHLPNRPPPTFSDTASMASSRGRGSSWGGRSRGGRGRGARGRGRGERNERWFEGYYDPSFNCNPWEKLEKGRGLEERGTWLQHPSKR